MSSTIARLITAAAMLDGATDAAATYPALMLANAATLATREGSILDRGKGKPTASPESQAWAERVSEYQAAAGCKIESARKAIRRLITVAVIVNAHASRIADTASREAWVMDVRTAVNTDDAETIAKMRKRFIKSPSAVVASRKASKAKAAASADVSPKATPAATAAKPAAKPATPAKPAPAPVPTAALAAAALGAFLADRRKGSDAKAPFRLTDDEARILEAMMDAIATALGENAKNKGKAKSA